MAKISNTLSYPGQSPIVGADYLIGTAANSSPISLQTKTFTIQGIADFVIDAAFDGVSYRLPVFTAATAGVESILIVDSLFYQDAASLGGKPGEVLGTTVYLNNGAGVGNLEVAQKVTVGSDLLVSGNTSLSGTLTVTGNSIFNDSVTMNQEIRLIGDIYDSTNTVGNQEQVLVSDANGKVTWQNFQGSGLEFQSAWNAFTNVPDLQVYPLTADNTGKYWVVSVAGTTPLTDAAGGTITDWEPGDWAIISEDIAGNVFWDKIDNSSVLTGQGTAGTIAIWTAPRELGDSPIKIGTGVKSLIYNDTGVNLASGEGSNAMGYTTQATGDYSHAMNSGTKASGSVSTAMGRDTIASQFASIAMGSDTTASGSVSTAMGDSTIASGTSSTAMGFTTIASGTSSTAMGQLSKAVGDYSTAMGDNTEASGIGSFSSGKSSAAKGNYSIAMGEGCIANTNNSLAIGSGSQSTGTATIAIGKNSITAESGSIAIGLSNTSGSVGNADATALGHGNNSLGSLSVAIGEANTVNSTSGVALGASNTVDGDFAFAQGKGNSVASGSAIGIGYQNIIISSSDYAVAIGDENQSSAIHAVALGNDNKSTAANSLTIGDNNVANAANAVAIGRLCTASAISAVAIGASATASGTDSISLGEGNVASGANTFASGFESTSTGLAGTAMGYRASVLGNYAFGAGYLPSTSGLGAVAIGYNVKALSSAAVSIGSEVQTNDSNSIGIGFSNNVDGNHAITIGNNLNSFSFRETVLGSYNKDAVGAVSKTTWVTTERLFTIGNGPSVGNESNALILLKSGNLALPSYGAGTITGTASYNLAVDSTGNVIEVATGGGGSGISGSGTQNYLTKFVANTTVGDSIVFEDSTTGVGVGTVTPKADFDASLANKMAVNSVAFVSGNAGKISIGNIDAVGSSTLTLVDEVGADVAIVKNGSFSIGSGAFTGLGSNKLDVGGNIRTTNSLLFSYGNASPDWSIQSDVNNNLIIDDVTGPEDVIFKNGGNVGIGLTGSNIPQSKLDVNGSIRMGDNSFLATASNVGTQRYRVSGNNSYVDMVMQTGATTYEWINIVQNNW